MKAIFSDKLRNNYKIFLEPILATAATHCGKKLNISRSKYIRYSLIRSLIEDKYPLNKITTKFDPFYKALKNKKIHEGITG